MAKKKKKKKKSSKEYIKKLDWSSVIAAETQNLKPNNNIAGSYLNRGMARCFTPDKEGKHKEAIEDLNNAIVLYESVLNNKNKAKYYRAYAFYLDGDYAKAIDDCRYEGCKQDNNKEADDEKCKKCCFVKDLCPNRYELLGKIYYAMNNYEKAVENFKQAMEHYSKKHPDTVFPSGLMDNYREACRRMNRQG
ncbi:MAG: tetratricopeptide repeat protein [Treponema sp.]|nr:tetratricopeptide repeat protein [Treponema sp.]